MRRWISSQELGLTLEDYNGGELIGLPEIYWFNGGYYTYAEASADWEHFGFAAFHNAIRKSNTDAGMARLDSLSAPEWLDETPIGSTSRFGQLMLSNTVSENGGDPGDQSALDLIGLTGVNPRSSLDPLPGYDEKWHVVGGNDQMVHGMAGQLPAASIQMGHRLMALRENSDASYTLTFEVDGHNRRRRCRLRHPRAAVHHAARRRPQPRRLQRRKAARHQHDGHGLEREDPRRGRRRRRGRGTVSTASPTPTGTASTSAGTTWSRSDPTAHPRCCSHFRVRAPVATRSPAPRTVRRRQRDTNWFLDRIEPIFPGTRAAFTGASYEDHWARDPWVKGAYSFYKVGQYAALRRHRRAQTQGRVHFAGEHTSINNQGFLDGAVETGVRAAKQIVAQL